MARLVTLRRSPLTPQGHTNIFVVDGDNTKDADTASDCRSLAQAKATDQVVGKELDNLTDRSVQIERRRRHHHVLARGVHAGFNIGHVCIAECVRFRSHAHPCADQTRLHERQRLMRVL